MVRTYLLTERERKILERFVETGEKLSGYQVLTHHLKKARKQLAKDVELINKTIKKWGNTSI